LPRLSSAFCLVVVVLIIVVIVVVDTGLTDNLMRAADPCYPYPLLNFQNLSNFAQKKKILFLFCLRAGSHGMFRSLLLLLVCMDRHRRGLHLNV
jgi:hypothetical protein